MKSNEHKIVCQRHILIDTNPPDENPAAAHTIRAPQTGENFPFTSRNINWCSIVYSINDFSVEGPQITLAFQLD